MLRAIFDFQPRGEDELALTEGQLYDAVEQLDDEWWRARDPRTEKVGAVPAVYVEIVGDAQAVPLGVPAALHGALVTHAPQLMAHGFAALDLSANPIISPDAVDYAFSEFFTARVEHFQSGWCEERAAVLAFMKRASNTDASSGSERIGAALDLHGALASAAGFSLDRIRAIAAPAPIDGTVEQLALCFATFLAEESESEAFDGHVDALLAEWGAIEQSLAVAPPSLATSSSSSSGGASGGEQFPLAAYQATKELVEKELKFVWQTQVLCDAVFTPLSAYVARGSLGRTNAADVVEIFTGCELLLVHHKSFLAGLLGIDDVSLFGDTVERFGRAAKEVCDAAHEVNAAQYAADSATTHGAQRIADARAGRRRLQKHVEEIVAEVAPRASLGALLARAPRAFDHLFKLEPFRAQLAATKAFNGHGSTVLARALSSDVAFKAKYGEMDESVAATIGKGVKISTHLRPPLFQRVMRYELHLDGIAKALRKAIAARDEIEGEVNNALTRAHGEILATRVRVAEALRQVDSAIWTLSSPKRRTIATDLFARLAKKFDGADAVVVASELEHDYVECTRYWLSQDFAVFSSPGRSRVYLFKKGLLLVDVAPLTLQLGLRCVVRFSECESAKRVRRPGRAQDGADARTELTLNIAPALFALRLEFSAADRVAKKLAEVVESSVTAALASGSDRATATQTSAIVASGDVAAVGPVALVQPMCVASSQSSVLTMVGLFFFFSLCYWVGHRAHCAPPARPPMWNVIFNVVFKWTGYLLPFATMLPFRYIDAVRRSRAAHWRAIVEPKPARASASPPLPATAKVFGLSAQRAKCLYADVLRDFGGFVVIWTCARFVSEPAVNVLFGTLLTHGEGAKGIASHAVMTYVAWGFTALSSDAGWLRAGARALVDDAANAKQLRIVAALAFAFLSATLAIYAVMAWYTTLHYHTPLEWCASMMAGANVLLIYYVATDHQATARDAIEALGRRSGFFKKDDVQPIFCIGYATLALAALAIGVFVLLLRTLGVTSHVCAVKGREYGSAAAATPFALCSQFIFFASPTLVALAAPCIGALAVALAAAKGGKRVAETCIIAMPLVVCMALCYVVSSCVAATGAAVEAGAIVVAVAATVLQLRTLDVHRRGLRAPATSWMKGRLRVKLATQCVHLAWWLLQTQCAARLYGAVAALHGAASVADALTTLIVPTVALAAFFGLERASAVASAWLLRVSAARARRGAPKAKAA